MQSCGSLLFPEQRTGGFRLEWPAKKESLQEVTPDLAQLAYLQFGLHAFSDRSEP